MQQYRYSNFSDVLCLNCIFVIDAAVNQFVLLHRYRRGRFWVRFLSGYRLLAQLLSAQAVGAGGLGFDCRAGEIGIMSPTARHRCDVSVFPRR